MNQSDDLIKQVEQKRQELINDIYKGLRQYEFPLMKILYELDTKTLLQYKRVIEEHESFLKEDK